MKSDSVPDTSEPHVDGQQSGYGEPSSDDPFYDGEESVVIVDEKDNPEMSGDSNDRGDEKEVDFNTGGGEKV